MEHHDKNCKLLKQVAGWNDLLSLGTSGRLWRRRDLLSREERPELEDDEHDRDRDRDLDRGMMKNGNDVRTRLTRSALRRLSLIWLRTLSSHQQRSDIIEEADRRQLCNCFGAECDESDWVVVEMWRREMEEEEEEKGVVREGAADSSARRTPVVLYILLLDEISKYAIFICDKLDFVRMYIYLIM